MGVPARLSRMVLAVAAATQVAAAAERFVPADPSFVVADLRDSGPDEALRKLVADWRVAPDASTTQALAEAFIERARSLREPRYFGRAEAILSARASQPGAPAPLRRLYALTLQHRHAFDAANGILDTLVREDRRDAEARLVRASLRLTRGDFAGARSDCAQLVGLGGAHASAGLACLAQALAGGGELARARALLEVVATTVAQDGASAYLLGTRAELAERAGDLGQAIADYQLALDLEPRDDALRAALADALIENGDHAAARRLLAVEKPSLALLVRGIALESGGARQALARRAREWLDLESARGDARHDRELALLEIVAGSADAAVAAARRNFRQQRELADIRALARAAVLAGDVAAQAGLREWLERTRFEDVVTAAILGARQPG